MDGFAAIDQATFNGLLDPPGGIGAESRVLIGIKTFDGAEQAEIALIDQVVQRHCAVGVFLGDVDDEAQVGFDHSLAGHCGIGLDLLARLVGDLARRESLSQILPLAHADAQILLLLCRQKRSLIDLTKVDLQACVNGDGGILPEGLPRRPAEPVQGPIDPFARSDGCGNTPRGAAPESPSLRSETPSIDCREYYSADVASRLSESASASPPASAAD